MYIFYEHHRDATGAITLTELRFTSYPDWWRIQFKNTKENAALEIAKRICKSPPIAQWSYDPGLYIWSYLGQDLGTTIIANVEAAMKMVTTVMLREIEDLRLYAAVGRYDPKRKQEIKPEDFFYKQEPTATVIPKESVIAQLTKLLEVSDTELVSADKDTLKKLYRRACLKLHPDRNNGDGSQMSELNMLWGIYNA